MALGGDSPVFVASRTAPPLVRSGDYPRMAGPSATFPLAEAIDRVCAVRSALRRGRRDETKRQVASI